MTCHPVWLAIFLLFLTGQVIADERPLDCVSENIEMLVMLPGETRSIGLFYCCTSLTIDKTSLSENSCFELAYGYFSLEQLYLSNASFVEIFNSETNSKKTTLLNDASIKLVDSTFTNKNESVLMPGGNFSLIRSTLTIEGNFSTTHSSPAFVLTERSKLYIKGDLTLKITSSQPPEKGIIESSKHSTVYFFGKGVEIKVSPGIYIPASYSVSLFKHHDKPSRATGFFRIIKNHSIARKFQKSRQGIITRHSGPSVYSQAASKGRARVAAVLLDSLIPVAEADPGSNDAKTLAYFDSITDQQLYDEEVLTYQYWGSAGRVYPQSYLFRLIPNQQGVVILTVALAVGLFIHCLKLPPGNNQQHLY